MSNNKMKDKKKIFKGLKISNNKKISVTEASVTPTASSAQAPSTSVVPAITQSQEEQAFVYNQTGFGYFILSVDYEGGRKKADADFQVAMTNFKQGFRLLNGDKKKLVGSYVQCYSYSKGDHGFLGFFMFEMKSLVASATEDEKIILEALKAAYLALHPGTSFDGPVGGC